MAEREEGLRPGFVPDRSSDSAVQNDRQSEYQKNAGARPRLGPVPWDHAVQLGVVPESGSDLLDPPKRQSSAASRSSVVNDLGNAKYLADIRTPGHTKPSSDPEASLDELVAYSGAGLSNSAKFQAIFDFDTTSQDEFNGRGPSLDGQSSDGESLGESIRAAYQLSQTGEKESFLPNDALDRIVTRERVREELSNQKLGPPLDLEHLTEKIWEVTKSRGKETTRRRIFAVLALMMKCEDIVGFIQNGVYDKDLPFLLLDEEHRGRPRLYRKRKDSSTELIPFLTHWRTPDHDFFYTYQWRLIVPYLTLLTDPDRTVLHYPLDDKIILPFIEDDEVKSDTGGFSDVWRVKIHAFHHNCCKNKANPLENPSYAVKRLRHSKQDAFDVEVSNLKRLSARDHVHLIKLLVTFKWRDHYYLLFPWADGNLLTFWKILYPEPSFPIRDHNFAVWFSKECLGLAHGLQMIHTAEMPSSDELPSVSSLQIHGRHGDLKPENILWFKSYDGTEEGKFGVLKISDFGLTRFHGTKSKSQLEKVALSPTYRPPEYDIIKMVSQRFDIWSLGCVLLEFVTWYLLGGEGVEVFSKERANDNSAQFREDVFFNFVTIKEKDGGTQLGARAKLSVANEFQALYSQENCSDFIQDLLTFIKDRLLRVSPEKRADCREIVEKFKELHKECVKGPNYCTERNQKIPERTGTGLSELRASALHLSQEMKDQIQRHNLPEHTGPLETDLPSNQPPESPSLSGDPDILSPYGPITRSISPERLQPSLKGSPTMRSTSPERRQSSLKGKSPEKMDTVPEERASLITASRGLRLNHETDSTPSRPSSIIYTGKSSSRPQSPNKKVQFEQSQQHISETGPTRLEIDFGAPHDLFSNQQDQNGERTNMMQDPMTLSHLGGPFITGLALTGLSELPLPTPRRKKDQNRAVEANTGLESTTTSLYQTDSTVDTDHNRRDEEWIDDNIKPPTPKMEESHQIDTENAENESKSNETSGERFLNGATTEPLEFVQSWRQNNSVNGGVNKEEAHVQDSPVNQEADGNSSHAQDKSPAPKTKSKTTSKRARVKYFFSRLFRAQSQKRKLRQLKNLEKG